MRESHNPFVLNLSIRRNKRAMALLNERLASTQSLGGQIWPQIWNQWPRLPTYPCAYCLWFGPFLTALEATRASKQPRRSNLVSVTSISYVTNVYHCHISLVHKIFPGGKMTLSPNSSSSDWNLGAIDFAVAIAPLVINCIHFIRQTPFNFS